LLQRCLDREPGAWNDFVDEYIHLIYHVIHHTAGQRSAPVSPEDIEDLAAEIFLQIVDNNYHVLRQFQGRSSLATYLTVIARRICIRMLAKNQPRARPSSNGQDEQQLEAREPVEPGIETVEEVQNLLARLPKKARLMVRMHYLEGRSYEEISSELGVPVNTIGPILSRARKALRQQLHQRREGSRKSPS
jgi:RNA polymerase sigma-70 factor (ECF subfamily)